MMDNPHVHLSAGLDATNPGQMRAAAIFFNSLAELADQAPVALSAPLTAEVCETNGPGPAPAKEEPKQAEPTKTEKPKRKRRSKAGIEADRQGEEAGAPPRMDDESAEDYLERISDELSPKSPGVEAAEDNGDGEEDEAPEDGAYTKSDVRALLGQKIDDHRSAIQAEMKKLKASNISTLKEADYGKFMAFLKTLD